MDPKPSSIIKTNSGSSLRYTSVRRHGGGGFGGQDIEKEVSKWAVENKVLLQIGIVMIFMD